MHDPFVMTKYGFDFDLVTFNIPDILVFAYIGSKKRKNSSDFHIFYTDSANVIVPVYFHKAGNISLQTVAYIGPAADKLEC